MGYHEVVAHGLELRKGPLDRREARVFRDSEGDSHGLEPWKDPVERDEVWVVDYLDVTGSENADSSCHRIASTNQHSIRIGTRARRTPRVYSEMGQCRAEQRMAYGPK